MSSTQLLKINLKIISLIQNLKWKINIDYSFFKFKQSNWFKNKIISKKFFENHFRFVNNKHYNLFLIDISSF